MIHSVLNLNSVSIGLSKKVWACMPDIVGCFSVYISNIILSVLASDLDYTKEVPGVRASSRSS